MKENKAIATEIWKISILYSKTSKEFYHHIKISEKYHEHKVFYKKAALNNFAIFIEKYLCWYLLFNKISQMLLHTLFCLFLKSWNAFSVSLREQDSLYSNFIKKRLQQRCFLVNIAKFLRTPILENICEWLLLRVFPFMSVWTFFYMKK